MFHNLAAIAPADAWAGGPDKTAPPSAKRARVNVAAFCKHLMALEVISEFPVECRNVD